MQKEKSLPYFVVGFIPHYLYKGLNLEHAKAFLEADADINYAISEIKNDSVSPIEKNGERYFMATKSGAKYFIDPFTHRKYEPGEKIKIENSIHLKAVK